MPVDSLQKQADTRARAETCSCDDEAEALTDSLSLANVISSNHLEVG